MKPIRDLTVIVNKDIDAQAILSDIKKHLDKSNGDIDTYLIIDENKISIKCLLHLLGIQLDNSIANQCTSSIKKYVRDNKLYLSEILATSGNKDRDTKLLRNLADFNINLIKIIPNNEKIIHFINQSLVYVREYLNKYQMMDTSTSNKVHHLMYSVILIYSNLMSDSPSSIRIETNEINSLIELGEKVKTAAKNNIDIYNNIAPTNDLNLLKNKLNDRLNILKKQTKELHDDINVINKDIISGNYYRELGII